MDVIKMNDKQIPIQMKRKARKKFIKMNGIFTTAYIVISYIVNPVEWRKIGFILTPSHL